MEKTLPKIKSTISNAPLGAVIGAAVGYIQAKSAGYDKTLTVFSFIIVGSILGATLMHNYRGDK